MRVTKFVHSCLLVETDNGTVLTDPGVYSWQSGAVDLNSIRTIDEIAITHVHQDHCHPVFIAAVIDAFPSVRITGNSEVADKLQAAGIKTEVNSYSKTCESFSVEHPSLPWAGTVPENNGFHIFDKLTHPGDTQLLQSTKDVLALPITAPWGSQTEQVEMALGLKPKTIIPIHDYHWHDQARFDAYEKSRQVFEAAGIEFIAIENSQPVEI